MRTRFWSVISHHVTARFRVLSVFVVLEVGTRRIVDWNVTEHPTADWTIRQFRTVMAPEASHRFVLHDRDGIYAAGVDRAMASMGRRVFETPVRTRQADIFCERHLRWILREWVPPTTGVVRMPAWDQGCPIRDPS